MAPGIPPIVVNILTAVQQAPVPGLSPAIEALKICIDLYNGVKTNRSDCDGLITRAADLLGKVNEIISERGENISRDDKMNKGLEEVISAIQKSECTVRLTTTKNWVYWIFHQDDLASSFGDAHTQIDDAFRVFQMQGDVIIFDKIQRSHSEILEELAAIKPTTSSLPDQELRGALRRLLAEHSDEDPSSANSPILPILKEILGSNAESDLPAYVTTSYETSRDERVYRGSWSTVWRGRWQNCVVAIKEVPITAEVTRQFFAVSSSSEVPFLVSPFMPNGNVMDYIKSHPEARRTGFVHDVAAGMQYLHSRNFVHGNLQGGNVLVTTSLTACVSGFGMSKLKHDELSTSSDEAFKKRNSEALRPWMAPERFMGKLTKPTDVWAFGMTVYEIFSGAPPFDGVDPQTIRKRVLGSKSETVTNHLDFMTRAGETGEFTGGMRKIVETALVYDRAARPRFNSILDMLAFIGST
ncbi:hypothetical protein FRB90_002990 [Tulasnella sp. 427]|nr:hypothetical protein FRB90_002990 [Tulasnella sp. 427]